MAVAPAWEMDSLRIGMPPCPSRPRPPHPLFNVWGRYRVEPDTFGAMAANTEAWFVPGLS